MIQTLLLNARLVGGAPEPCAVLLGRGLVRAIGTAAAAGAPRRCLMRATEVVDLDGRYVMRGLWDEHVHMDQWALARRRLDVSACDSAAACADLVRRRLDHDPPPAGQPLVGHGFRDGVWPDAPSAALLDAVAPGVPVLLISHDLHCGWLNSAGFAFFGVPVDDGGLVREGAFRALTPRLSQVPDALLDTWVRDAGQAAAARGVTGMVDFEMAENVDSWRRRIEEGARSLRVEAVLYRQHLADAVARRLRSRDRIAGTRGLLRVGPLKMLVDGSLNTRTAYCREPYPEPGRSTDPHGSLLVPPDELVTVMREAHRHELRCAIHAIGDEATRIALDGFERSGAGGSVEHAQLVRAEDLPRFAELGVAAGVQPAHAVGDRDVADRHWPGRTGRAFAYADLWRHGATLRFGSDAPVAPLDPWVTLASAVHRSDDGRPPWHPEQQMPVTAALAASTRGRYTPRPGDRADLVVTDLDPLAAAPDELRSMPVYGTLLAGDWTWRGTEPAAGVPASVSAEG